MELKFAPFTSSINPGFWSALTKLKLDVLGLKEEGINVHAYYENKFQPTVPTLLTLDWNAFDPGSEESIGSSWSAYSSNGVVINYNTLEAFKKFDKNEYLNSTEGNILYEAMTCCGDDEFPAVLKDPRILTRFVCHTFADLKKYHYYYWFVFPAFILPPTIQMSQLVQPICDFLKSEEIIQKLAKTYLEWKKSNLIQSGFFWIQTDPVIKITNLKDGFQQFKSYDDVILGFADPSSLSDYPGWPLRNLIAFICYYKPELLIKGLKVLGLRQTAKDGNLDISSSIILNIKCSDQSFNFTEKFKMTGWEKNDKNQFGPKFANMKSSMDPKSLAENSVDLNLKLMKWRLVPDLDLSKFSNVKCLLLGSGTLGCNVARCLLGWGVKNITFVDNGKVSYSNPVRQSLFNFEHCLDGGQLKAQAAATMLEKIFPGVKTEGHNLTIPMPGHPISDSIRQKVQEDYEKLEALISSHDVIYLLMDTRESRWLPTLMSANHGKLVINAALGFDSFLVMRHGVRNEETWKSNEISLKSEKISGNQLGCYYCNDVVAPGNSTKDRTLDQQCTVTRPGVSYQAAAYAVELMASILQHPCGSMASARCTNNVVISEAAVDDEGPLGHVVHSIRGSISNFTVQTPTTSRFTNCTACSQKVLQEFATQGFDLLLKTSQNPKYLEDLTGLSALLSEDQFDDVIECFSDYSEDD